MIWEKYEDVETFIDEEQYLVNTVDDEMIILDYHGGVWTKSGEIVNENNINLIIPMDEVKNTLPKPFKIVITETLKKENTIIASSKDEALEIAWDKYHSADDDYILNASNYEDTSIKAIEEKLDTLISLLQIGDKIIGVGFYPNIFGKDLYLKVFQIEKDYIIVRNSFYKLKINKKDIYFTDDNSLRFNATKADDLEPLHFYYNG